MTDEQRVKRRGQILLVVIALLSIAPLYDQYGHPVRVYDGSTGEPLAGVFAINRWGGSTIVPFVSRGICHKVAVARTGENGVYFMPVWSWSAEALLLEHYGTFFVGNEPFLYRPGYYEGPEHANPPGQRIMWRDTRVGMDRLRAISLDQQRAACFDADKAHRIFQLAPVHHAMVEEAELLASTPNERIERGRIRFWRNELVFGSEVAAAISRREREREEKK